MDAVASPSVNGNSAAPAGINTPSENGAQTAPPKWDGVLKLNKEGREEAVDFNDPSVREKIQRRLQKEDISDKRMSDAIQASRRVAEFEQSLKSGKLKALMQMGIPEADIRKEAEEYLYQKIQEEQMPAEKREALQERRAREAAEQRLQQIEQQRQTQEREYGISQIKQQLEPMVLKEAQAQGLPTSKLAYERTIERLRQQDAYGMKIDVKEAVAVAKEDVQNMVTDLIKGAPIESVIKMLGEDVVNKIRQYNIQKIQNTRPITQLGQQNQQKPIQRNEKKYISPIEWKKQIRERAGLP